MTPNGMWIEKGEEVVNTTRIDSWRKNKLLLSVVLAIVCILLLAVGTGAAVYYYYAPTSKKTLAAESPCDALCLFGSQCLVDDSTQRPYCMCRETCSDVFAPVCGNDNVTYSSECQLRVSSCTQQRKLLVVKQGSCDIQDPCETRECAFGSYCSTSFDGRTAQCVCSDKCPETVSDQGAVCGSDGRNYPNQCELLKVSCREMRSIEIKFKGACDPCEGVECPTSQTCQLDDFRKPVCRCNSVCSPDFRPVCGSDGKTYTNECKMRVEACKSRKNIRIIYTGECSSGANPCESLQCGPFQSCDIDHHGKATCHCDEVCEPAIRLVCGSDGQTYHNDCDMKKQGCLQKKMIKLLYKGECGERGPCYHHHCSYNAICVVRGGFPSCECPTCAEEFEPVCGTDGISYTNNCKLRREACEQKTEIAVAYTGLCTGCENKRCEYYAVCESDGRGNGKCVCPETCIQVESLVCGTDEVTYLNECEMRVAACKKAQYVMVVAKGPCDLCQGVHCKYGARCEEGKCVCPTNCPQADEVVCANDGTTYRNECEMRSAACRHDQELNVLFYGECDEVGETQDEGSGIEMDCHERSCRYGGICEYDTEGLPFCACAFQCPVVFDPVCGSDGRLHDNECRLKEESCKQQKNLMAVHIEMCEEFREVPCDGEMPLQDSNTNKDYYCGDELGAKLCPPGSYCHKSTAFAKCCREVILIKSCIESTFGCCPDGKTAAQGINNAGCPSVCNCNRLGSYGLTCEPTTKQCFCKPGVGGPKCDRCEPGYWGLHRITEENNDGCTPCSCNLYGSVRDDCEQMTGRCVCKQNILGMKCDVCPVGTVLGPDGCMDESIAQPVSGSCDDLFCFHGALCREKEGDMAQCVCETTCSLDDHKSEPVCASDGNTYSSECQMKLFACRYQKEMLVTRQGPCEKGPKNRMDKNAHTAVDLDYDNDFLIDYSNIPLRRGRHLYNKTSPSSQLIKERRTLKDIESQRTSFKLTKLIPFGRIVIDIDFVTFEKNGVIFYCGGETGISDVFILLMIRNKYLELRVNGLNESLVLRPHRQLDMGRRHQVSVRRFPHFASIHLDKKWVAMRSCDEKYNLMTFPQSFNLGSVPVSKEKSLNKNPGYSKFIGCFYKLRIGKHTMNLTYLVDESTLKNEHDSLVLNTSFNDRVNTRLFKNSLCFPNTTDYGWREYQQIVNEQETARTDVPKKVFVLIAFRTTERSVRPLLVWKSDFNNLTSQVRLDIDDGKMQLSLICNGTKNVTMRSSEKINDKKFHRFILQRSLDKLEAYFDNKKETLLHNESCSIILKEGETFLLGRSIDTNSHLNKDLANEFGGCIAELHLTNRTIDLQKLLGQNSFCNPS